MPKPLAGLRVIELANFIAGPLAGTLLADMGADVIKIEPLEGDLSRRVSSHSTEFDGDSGFFLSVNRGKSSIALDLKKPEGRAVMHDLARNADAIIYGFAPAVPARLGLDRATLHGINPRLTIAQLIGLHDEPPYSDAPAFDLVVQAMAGVMSITGERDDLIELRCDLSLLHAKDRAAEKDVLAAGKLRMKAGAHFEEASYAAV